ncbi:MAG TPA: MlaD family protein [Stellaceae bacterium]|jgi:phospholipid/cholesterol/gamma-HCH transport system substrate-binding protein
METRASYVAVGAFVIALLAGLVVAVLWFAHGQLVEHVTRYETYFASVGSGLSQGSPVRVSGVQLGHVVSVALDRDDPTRVRVSMDIDTDAPIRSDSVASLEIQSLAGTTAVEITPGSKDAPPIAIRPGRQYPVIWSRQSNLQQIVDAVPDLVAKLAGLTDRLGKVVDDQNRQALTDTLDNLSQLSAVAAAHREDLARLLQDSATDAHDLHQAIANLNDVTQKLDQVADQASTTMRSIEGAVQENRGALKTFTQDGLPQFQQLALDARNLVAELSRTVDALNRDPSSLLYGDRRQGYRPQ